MVDSEKDLLLQDKVPIFMQNQMQALKVAVCCRRAQIYICKKKAYIDRALNLIKEFELEQFQYGSGWISGITEVAKRLEHTLFRNPLSFDAQSYSSSSSLSENGDSDIM